MMQKLLRFFIPKYLHLPPSRDNISHVSTENISILGKRTAARVRAVMAYRRISVNDMADKLHTHRLTLTKKLNAEQELNLGDIERICKITRCRLSTLMSDKPLPIGEKEES